MMFFRSHLAGERHCILVPCCGGLSPKPAFKSDQVSNISLLRGRARRKKRKSYNTYAMSTTTGFMSYAVQFGSN